MIREHFQYRTTIATIIAERRAYIDAAGEAMVAARQEVEAAIDTDPFFGMTLEPIELSTTSLTVRRMVDAAKQAGVGPMAAVAGTIAWAGAEAMQQAGASHGIVDNGGDIALFSDHDVRIGLYAGDAPISGRYAFVIPPQQKILGICTSSATVGPSISLGTADAATVISHDVALADAWATALCNRAESGDDTIFAPLKDSNAEGALVVMGEDVRSWKRFPKLVPARVEEALITAGR
jgi:ApbE superfamily uncharacterized protein (UPF0280 family)